MKYKIPSTEDCSYEELKSLLFILRGIVRSNKTRIFIESVNRNLEKYGTLSVKQTIAIDKIRKQYKSFFNKIEKLQI